MGIHGLNSAAAERACRQYQLGEETARRSAGIPRTSEIAAIEAETAKPAAKPADTPETVGTKVADQATALVETATIGNGIGARAKRAWASMTGRFARPGTTEEGSDK